LIDVAREFLETHDPAELTLARIGKLAGVGASSTYKSFSSDEDLLHAVIERLQKEVWDDLGVFDATPEKLPAIPLAAFPVYRAYKRNFEIILHTLSWQRHLAAGRSRRLEAMAAQLSDVAPGLSERQLAMAAAMLQVMAAPRTWYWMEEAAGLTTEEAALAASWATRTMLGALQHAPEKFPAPPSTDKGEPS
jgi:AcrR family transcriptional regulator